MEIVTQRPGHAAEEVERLVTIPIEIEMNGIPRLEALRSISLYGLSSVQMNFDYRYVLQNPDRSPKELKTIDDWVLNRRYRSIQRVADKSGLGGTTMQYQVLLDPNKLFAYGVSVPQISQQLTSNNANAGGGFYSQGGQFYYIRGLGLVRNTQEIGNVVVSEKGGIPVYVHDLAQVSVGHAPRLGQFGFMRQPGAVEGVILMRVGEQAQATLKRVEAITKELNEHILPPDVKIKPFYDRQGLISETTDTVEANLLRGMLLVLLILGIFLFSVRTALIVAVTIPFALLFSFICLDWRHIPANLLSIGAIDFGIIVDGAVVMVEHIFRELASRYVGLKPYSDRSWSGGIHTKPELIEAIQKKLSAFPGIIFNYTQPAEDAVDEAETGLKSALAVKIFGGDLKVLDEKAAQVKSILQKVKGITEITVVRELGQPILTITPNRDKLARYGLNVDDVNTMVETAMGGKAVTQLIQGERQFDLVVRMQPQFRSDENAIKNLLISTPDGQNLPLSQFADIHEESGASFIYRESNSRYLGVQFSVEGRDLAGAVGEARKKVEQAVKLPIGYRWDWGGEYKEYLASREQMKVILPLTVLLILVILFALYGNLKFPLIIFFSVLVTEPVGGLLALRLTGTNFSVSSMLGFVALMGVAVQTSVILYSFINKLRLEGEPIMEATLEASLLRLRPIMMTALVACFGLLPAAMSTGIGSDSQKPFAIVIVGGLASRLLLSIFLAPVLYALVARDGDTLQV